MEKKEQRFQLNKGGEHKFDIHKGGKRKFDLTKDADETPVEKAPEVQPAKAHVAPAPAASAPTTKSEATELKPKTKEPKQPQAPTISPSEDRPSNRSQGWIWGIVAVIALLCLIWLFWPTDEETPAMAQAETEQVEPAGEVADVQDAGDVDAVEAETVEAEAVSADQAKENVAATSATESNNVVTSDQSSAVAANPSSAQSAEQPASTMKTVPTSSPSGDIEAVAADVIRGTYGNGMERKDCLGSRYAEVQARVNQMKKQGLF
ncbi:MAG: hypothetical protein LUC85_07095 [Bacteroidales bacterium]|nr:hypothetical protein [Bacteroidales bacterium]MCD8394586.1 hypothetical protein [Bacteroidales bacterium]